jgi:hypothetical protein
MPVRTSPALLWAVLGSTFVLATLGCSRTSTTGGGTFASYRAPEPQQPRGQEPTQPAAALQQPAGPVVPGCGAPVPAPPPPLSAPVVIKPTGDFKLGLNLAAVEDWSREWAFVDAFRAARAWEVAGGGQLKFDERGNPLPAAGQTAWTLVLREVQGRYPAGRYVVTWKGAGELVADKYDVTKVVETSPGRAVIDVKPGDGGIQIDVKSSKPDDPVRDIRVWMPGFENAPSRFHPVFLQRLGPARVVRFMDWQRTNNSKLVKWADRPKPDDPTYATERGAPVEVMCALANTAKAHAWFCMPHQADDDFVRQFARLVKAQLAPELKAYVEYSNEVWNWQFQQAAWANERGKERKLGAPEHLRFYAERSAEVMKIWEEELGRDRLVRVIASQAAVPDISDQILAWKDAHKRADVLAVAPYFGHEYGDPKAADEASKLTADQVIAALEKEIDGPNRDLIRKQGEVAAKYGLKLVAYEGGQHLVGHGGAENNEALTRLFHAANRHPRMYDLYVKHLKHWAEAGGDAYVLFNYVTAPSKWGSWGLLEYQDQPAQEAHKYRAFLDVAAATKK